jgi:NAD(P)-dependent dehydrogenase (short-subunit alcohol dehydrogenase family)
VRNLATEAPIWPAVSEGHFWFVGREAARRLIPLGRGTVIFTGASGSLRGKPGYAQFAAAKAGLRMQRSGVIVASQSRPGCTTITSGYNFRKG